MTDETRDRWAPAGWLLLGVLALQVVGNLVDVGRGELSATVLLFATASIAHAGLVPLLGALLLGIWTRRAGTALLRMTAFVALLFAVVSAIAVMLTFLASDSFS